MGYLPYQLVGRISSINSSSNILEESISKLHVDPWTSPTESNASPRKSTSCNIYHKNQPCWMAPTERQHVAGLEFHRTIGIQSYLSATQPIGSMCGISTYMYHKNQPNIGTYTNSHGCIMGHGPFIHQNYPKLVSWFHRQPSILSLRVLKGDLKWPWKLRFRFPSKQQATIACLYIHIYI